MQSTVQIHEHSLWVGGKSQTGKKSGERENGNERKKLGRGERKLEQRKDLLEDQQKESHIFWSSQNSQ